MSEAGTTTVAFDEVVVVWDDEAVEIERPNGTVEEIPVTQLQQVVFDGQGALSVLRFRLTDGGEHLVEVGRADRSTAERVASELSRLAG